MSFTPKAGCPICGIVAAAASLTPTSATAESAQPDILWKDDNFTAYKEKLHPVSSKGHVVIAFNLHVPSIYTLSSSDLPLLVNVRNLARQLLSSLARQSSSRQSPVASASSSPSLTPINTEDESQFRIGFITPPFKDNKIPVTDHLHAHAYIAPADLMGWWRGIAYGPLAWYAIDDLIAEIRESVSNNRVKSGYENRQSAPIDTVPQAGARMGTPDGVELTEPGLSNPDLEVGEGSPSVSRPHTPASLLPSHQIPRLNIRT